MGLCAVVAGGAWAVWRGAVEVPYRFNPWAPIDVMASPDWFTGFRVMHARSDAGRCQAALAQTGMQYDALPDRVTGPGCGFDNAVRLRAAPVRIGAPLSLSCPMALSFFLWERHALQPAAQAHFGQRVVGVEH
ncbi:MAG: extensin, partial [Comamonadaceae bacterium]